MNLHLQSHEIGFINVLASFVVVIILNTLTFTSFVLLGTHTFVENSSTALELPLYLPRQTWMVIKLNRTYINKKRPNHT